jgi:hypothetical protein
MVQHVGANFKKTEGKIMKLHSFIYIAILAYIITVGTAREAEAATHNFKPYMELGTLVNESDASHGSIGVTYNDKWQVSKMFIGEGDTKYGEHPKAKIWTIDRLINPGWMKDHFFMLLGVAKVESSYLVEPYNYHVGTGWKWKTGKIYYHHFSSADINTQNTGIDMITWRIYL